MSEIFRFLSSIRLAVPLLLVLAAIVAAGTLLESYYSAAYAKLLIYDTLWFYALMGLLGVNILCAALSRWPWKIRHTGFVITHAGMLLMLTGALITAVWGIDGELKIEEGGQASEVGLPALELTVTDNGRTTARAAVPRYVRPRDAHDLKWLSARAGGDLIFKTFLPFTMPEEEFVSAPQDPAAAPAVSFWLRSRFFNTSEWLHARERAELTMGPARLRLITGRQTPERSPDAKARLKVFSHPERELLATLDVERLRSGETRVGDSRIRLVQAFEQASVVGNRLVEKGAAGVNPALELAVTTPAGKFREVSFANFADFSLVKDPEFRLRFEYVPAAPRRPDANLIEFHVSPEGQVRLELYKQGQLVLKESVKEGSSVDTPWMGMKIVVARILPAALIKPVVRALPAPAKGAMPPSALEIALAANPSESYWLMEGDSLEIPTASGLKRVTYGYKSLKLPFSVRLNRFVKEEYPGTDKALSFESHVVVPETNEASVISMNNPLARAGYTLYQSSFQMLPGRPPVSILSVNQDPGRYVKYLGGLVTSLGIVIYVLMRSRFRWRGKGAK